MKHLMEDYGTTALISTLVIVGAFSLLWKGVDQSLETALVGIISSIVSAVVVIKSAKMSKPKE